MRPALLFGGAAIIAVGAGAALVLPNLPSAVQVGPLQSVGTSIINNSNYIVLAGLLLILVSLFL